MDKLFSIRQPITEELALLNKTLTESLHTTSPLMNEVIQAYLESKGKQIRPILVLLCAKLFGEVPREAIDAAASLEMLHNASLIHDDVVDESQKRRGLPTINHLRKCLFRSDSAKDSIVVLCLYAGGCTVCRRFCRRCREIGNVRRKVRALFSD